MIAWDWKTNQGRHWLISLRDKAYKMVKYNTQNHVAGVFIQLTTSLYVWRLRKPRAYQEILNCLCNCSTDSLKSNSRVSEMIWNQTHSKEHPICICLGYERSIREILHVNEYSGIYHSYTDCETGNSKIRKSLIFVQLDVYVVKSLMCMLRLYICTYIVC